MKILAVILSITIASAASAGGDGFLAKKRGLILGSHFGGYTLTLSLIDESKELLGCRQLTIHGKYNFWRWWIQKRGKTSPIWNNHRMALKALSESEDSFIFGTIGQGLKPTEKECEFRSEGLTPQFDENGQLKQIISFYLTS